MSASIQAVRAITGVTFQRLLLIAAVIGGIVLVVLWALTITLATSVNSLFWLFLILIVPVTLLALVLFFVLKALGRKVVPRHLTTAQRTAARGFSNKLLGLVDTLGTPPAFALLLIAKDVVRRRPSSYIEGAIANSSTLQRDFRELKELF